MTGAIAKHGKSDQKKVTKRQKLKSGPNPSNTWLQQPKIKSMAARDEAYIRMAGLGKKKKASSAKKEPLNPSDDVINSPEYKFGRLLASPLARTRHTTILKLKDYLKARTNPCNVNGGLNVLDLMRLWKGMWHTLYLCDGVAVQEEVSKVLAGLIWSVGGTLEEDEYAGRFYLELDELDQAEMDGSEDGANEGEVMDEEEMMQVIDMSDEEDDDITDGDLSNQINEQCEEDGTSSCSMDDSSNPADDEETKHCRGAHLSALFVRTYFRTLKREWSNMDKYRIDKFYTLTRLVLRELYRYMASRHWNLGIIRLFNDAIFEEVLRDNKFGNGIRFHLLDISLDELAMVNSEKETGLPLTEATYLDCMEPFFAMAQRVDDEIVHERVIEKVLAQFLDKYSVVSDNYSDDSPEEKKKLVMNQVHVQTVAQFLFELASDNETEDRYRTQLYDMYKTYMKRIKAVGRDVLLDNEEEESKEEDLSNINDDEDDIIVHNARNISDGDQSQMDSETSNNDNNRSLDDQTTSDQNSDKKKKKKKKKEIEEAKKSQSIDNKGDNEGKSIDRDDDFVVTISSKAQKAAANLARKSKKQKQTKRLANSATSDRKVKFGKLNRSKSFKASMKGLENIDAKATLGKLPEKSILLASKYKNLF